jgi:hypothetical protein
MKVFIGWSGERSKQIALQLHTWLPKVIQRLTPWISARDIQAGGRWHAELNKQLQQTNFGIIALTRESAHEPWIHFEAGALAKQVEEGAVCPYLIDIADETEITGPLTQFQAKKANKDDTLSLVRDINVRLAEEKLADKVLEETFALWWPELEEAISNLSPVAATQSKRSDRDLLEEVLDKVRAFDRQTFERVRTIHPLRLTSGPIVSMSWPSPSDVTHNPKLAAKLIDMLSLAIGSMDEESRSEFYRVWREQNMQVHSKDNKEDKKS